ncbi:hypothetical protein D9M69_474430 [compost metagenome]
MPRQADFHERLAGDRVGVFGLFGRIGTETGADLALPLVALAFLFFHHREGAVLDLALVGTDHRVEQAAQISIEFAAVIIVEAGHQQGCVQPRIGIPAQARHAGHVFGQRLGH